MFIFIVTFPRVSALQQWECTETRHNDKYEVFCMYSSWLRSLGHSFIPRVVPGGQKRWQHHYFAPGPFCLLSVHSPPSRWRLGAPYCGQQVLPSLAPPIGRSRGNRSHPNGGSEHRTADSRCPRRWRHRKGRPRGNRNLHRAAAIIILQAQS